MSERERFEVWFVLAYHRTSLLPMEDGCYLNLGAGMAWDAWQAAIAAAAPAIRAAERERCAKECDDLSDVGGWDVSANECANAIRAMKDPT